MVEQRVLEHLDIDTRRTMGLPPRRLRHIPDIRFPKSRLFARDNIHIKVSPWRLWFFFTVYVTGGGVNYAAESEYCCETGWIIPRLTGGPTHHRLYQIVDVQDEEPSVINVRLRQIHNEFRS